MGKIYRYRNLWRLIGIALFLVAALGPWMYSADGVPPAEWCADPLILMENGRCYRLETGLTVYLMLGGIVYSIVRGLFAGTYLWEHSGGMFFRELLFTLVLIMPGVAFLTTLWQAASRYRRSRQVFHIVIWGLAALAAIPFIISIPDMRLGALWGLSLYLGVVVISLLWEILVFFDANRPPANPVSLASPSSQPT